MKSLPETLPTDTFTLHKMVHDYQLTVDEMAAKLAWYEEQFRLFKHRQFGLSSEKTSDQMDLFNEAESIIDAQQQSFDLADRLSEYCPSPIQKLNIGGGYGIPYFPGEKPLDTQQVGDALEVSMNAFKVKS